MLRIAKNLKLPDEAVTQTFAILAQRRKGKTYTANVIAEEMVAAGIPWVALDPTGAWWGLRSSPDGKSPGLPVYVFGGDHGDLPLERTAGKMIADLVVDHPGWYVLDFSHLESKEAERQVATDFAERFYRRKGANKSPMHLFVDEADMFAPQRTPSGDQRMLGAFEALVRRGGIRGIGTTLITQRAAVLNKNVLEQIDVLIALRTVGPNDRKAISGYVEANGTPEQQTALMNSLASLELGEAWVWEPGADLFQRVRIRERKTFNSSATPDTSAPTVVKLAKVDLKRISDQMAATIERAEANDPRRLQRKVIELERELKKQPATTKEVIKEVEVPIITDEQIQALTNATLLMQTASDDIIQTVKAAGLKHTPPVGYPPLKPASITPDPAPSHTLEPKTAPVNGGAEPAGRLGPGEMKILTAAGQHPAGITRGHLTILTGYKRSSRNTYISRLVQRGLIEAAGDAIQITDAGVTELGNDFDPLPTGDALQQRLLTELPAGEKSILKVLIDAYPNGLSRDAITEATGYMRSSRNTYLSRMTAREIIEVNGQEVRAADNLFAGAV